MTPTPPVPEIEHKFAARMQGSINDYHVAPGGDGPLAAEWKNKPHRLLYDLLGEIQTERLARQQAERERANAIEAIADRDAQWTRLSIEYDNLLKRKLDSEQARAQAEQVRARLRTALERLIGIIDKAGLLNLSNGVQLGPVSWYVKASDCLDAARAALTVPQETTTDETP